MKTDKRKPPAKWKPIMLLDYYRMKRAGMSDTDASVAMGLKSKTTLVTWRKLIPELRRAAEIAAEEIERDRQGLADWVFERLPDDLKDLWQEVERVGLDGSPAAALEGLLSGRGKGVRQRLFLHALCKFNYNPSRAMQAVNLSRAEYDKWCDEDRGFQRLVEEIPWHKANFLEDALVGLVREGNPQAVIFANKTVNAGRGYGALGVLRHEHTGSVETGRKALDLQDLAPYLSEAAKEELLLAVRNYTRDQLKGPETARDVLYREVAGPPAVSGPGVTSP